MEWIIGIGLLLFLAYFPVKKFLQNNGQKNRNMVTDNSNNHNMNDHKKNKPNKKSGGCC
jgi:hypothetical protein